MSKRIGIVGGGIIGLTTAEVIRRRFVDAEINIFDQDMIGRGASSYSVGLSFPFARSQQVRDLIHPLDEDWPELLMGVDNVQELYRPLSFVGLSGKGRSAETLSGFLPGAAQNEDIAPSFREHLGFGNANFGFETVSAADCFWGDVGNICQVIAKRLRQSPNVSLYEATEIVNLNANASRPVFRDQRGAMHEFDFVVIAIGPYTFSGPFSGMSDLLGLRTKRIVALHIDSPPPSDAPIVFYHDADAFILPQPEARRWLYSFTCDDWDVQPDRGYCEFPMKISIRQMEYCVNSRPLSSIR